MIHPTNDPMGLAILDELDRRLSNSSGKEKKREPLRVVSSMFDEDEMPVGHLLRQRDEMPYIEQAALDMARGRILDVGAGAGCHSLALQEEGFSVKAIDISPLCCEAMRRRGIKDVECIDIFDCAVTERFDTILLIMNGTGIAGKASRLPLLLNRLKSMLQAGGQILIDSSDIKYVYMNEDGSFDINLNGNYYGEVDYQMIYKDVKGEPFDWLYIDYGLLSMFAGQCGMRCELVEEGEHYDYLARLTIEQSRKA